MTDKIQPTRFTVVLIFKDTMDGQVLATSVHLPSTKGLSDADLKKCLEFSPALQASGIAMAALAGITADEPHTKPKKKAA